MLMRIGPDSGGLEVGESEKCTNLYILQRYCILNWMSLKKHGIFISFGNVAYGQLICFLTGYEIWWSVYINGFSQ
jgi:hypothetical protein